MINKFFMPDLYVDTIYDITPDMLTSRGIRAVMLDIDNTLVPYENATPTDEVLGWLGALSDAGISAAFVSNNNAERVEKFNEMLGYPAYPGASKPSKKAYRAAMSEMGVTPSECCVIGDQIYTDVWSAKRIGAYSILVKPIKDKTSLFFKFKRSLEKPILRKYEKNEFAKSSGAKPKKHRVLISILLICVIAALACGGFVLGVNVGVKNSTRDRILSAEDAAKLDDVDCILVLGAGVRSDGSPSDILRDRVKVGVGLYELGASPKLLLSGDHGRVDYDEVNAMKKLAVDAGVPSYDAFMDHAGFSTYESLVRAKNVFGARKIIIVTNEYHLFRALYIAKELGLDAYGVSADLRQYRGSEMRELREAAARVKDFVYTALSPEPTFLGDPISLAGDGDVTNDDHSEAYFSITQKENAA